MPITPARLSKEELQALYAHFQKHKIYPFRSTRFNKAVTNGNFGTADAAGGIRYFTRKWTPDQGLGIVAIALSMIVTPQTLVDTFGVAISYKSTFTLGDGGANEPDADEEATQIYQILTQGGAINDFQVFYPLTWYLEAGTPLYVHVFGGTAAMGVAGANVAGHVLFGTLPTGIK